MDNAVNYEILRNLKIRNKTAVRTTEALNRVSSFLSKDDNSVNYKLIYAILKDAETAWVSLSDIENIHNLYYLTETDTIPHVNKFLDLLGTQLGVIRSSSVKNISGGTTYVTCTDLALKMQILTKAGILRSEGSARDLSNYVYAVTGLHNRDTGLTFSKDSGVIQINRIYDDDQFIIKDITSADLSSVKHYPGFTIDLLQANIYGIDIEYFIKGINELKASGMYFNGINFYCDTVETGVMGSGQLLLYCDTGTFDSIPQAGCVVDVWALGWDTKWSVSDWSTTNWPTNRRGYVQNQEWLWRYDCQTSTAGVSYGGSSYYLSITADLPVSCSVNEYADIAYIIPPYTATISPIMSEYVGWGDIVWHDGGWGDSTETPMQMMWMEPDIRTGYNRWRRPEISVNGYHPDIPFGSLTWNEGGWSVDGTTTANGNESYIMLDITYTVPTMWITSDKPATYILCHMTQEQRNASNQMTLDLFMNTDEINEIAISVDSDVTLI